MSESLIETQELGRPRRQRQSKRITPMQKLEQIKQKRKLNKKSVSVFTLLRRVK